MRSAETVTPVQYGIVVLYLALRPDRRIPLLKIAQRLYNMPLDMALRAVEQAQRSIRIAKAMR